MSLDVSLRLPGAPAVPRIFIREDGQNREITREEWDRRYPGREPFVVASDDEEVFSWNITHNLNQMAQAAGIYAALWRPDEAGIERAGQLIAPLREGLERLHSDPVHYWKFNPANGWGTYEGLIEFVTAYLAACEQYPTARVMTCR